MVQYASLFLFPWAVLLWFDSNILKQAPSFCNSYLLLTAVFLLNIPQGESVLRPQFASVRPCVSIPVFVRAVFARAGMLCCCCVRVCMCHGHVMFFLSLSL